MIYILEPVADNYNGMACYTVLVKFFARNRFNAVTRNSAYVSVMKMGGKGEVVKYEING
jgi:hypothetical protein